MRTAQNMHQTLIITAAVLCTLHASVAATRTCRSTSKKIVFCNDRQFTQVPYGIPNDTLTLHLQDNSLISGRRTDENLSQLGALRKLDLYNNRLTALPTGLPATLELLSLRNNQLKFIGSRALLGLRHLVRLQLDGNYLTNKGLSTATFADAASLRELGMENNLLTSIPEGLPPSLRVLQLTNNSIRYITASSLERLSQLRELYLLRNVIAEQRIDAGALVPLLSLRVLDISDNQLTEIPPGLPRGVVTLRLSRNSISYVYSADTAEHGSLSALLNLTAIDLSENRLRSVAPGAFDALSSAAVELQQNPWNCDCYLTYLKRWLSRQHASLSRESFMRCQQPEVFRGVTLNNIEVEALTCAARTRDYVQGHLAVAQLAADRALVTWERGHVITPGFVRRKLLVGALLCDNCSLDDDTPVAALMSSVRVYDVTDDVTDNVNVTVDGLRAATRYAVCAYDSLQPPSLVSTHQCVQVTTSPVGVASISTDPGNQWPPTWLVVVCCVIATLTLSLGVLIVLWKKQVLFPTSTKTSTATQQGFLGGRRDFYFSGSSHHYAPPHYPAPPAMTSSSHLYERAHAYETQRSDRTYAECGSCRSVPDDSAVDARRDFTHVVASAPSRHQVMTSHLRGQSMTSQQPARNVTPFLDSTSSRSPDTLSTNQTLTMGSRDSSDENPYLLASNSSSSSSRSTAYDHLMHHVTPHQPAPPTGNYGNLVTQPQVTSPSLRHTQEMYV